MLVLREKLSYQKPANTVLVLLSPEIISSKFQTVGSITEKARWADGRVW